MIQEGFGAIDNANLGQDSAFSPLAAPFQSRIGNELLNLINQQEPNVADTGNIN